VNGVAVQNFRPNAFGDGEAFHHQRAAVDEVLIVASGRVETRDQHGVVSGFRQDVPLRVFLRQTRLTHPDAAVMAFAHSAGGEDNLSRLHALSALVGNVVGYSAGSTSAASTAHLFVSAARTLGIPARYVVGYLMAQEGGQALRETHAWSEAWVDGLGWIGFDSTNGLCVTDHYVRLCCGLDAHDAAPVRGSVVGATAITIRADVMISETEPNAAQQTQQQQ
jgi:hypothetical protein